MIKTNWFKKILVLIFRKFLFFRENDPMSLLPPSVFFLPVCLYYHYCEWWRKLQLPYKTLEISLDINKSTIKILKLTFVTKILTQFENESEKYYKNPNNFQYELVKTGIFPCMLGIIDAKKCTNLFTNISWHLQPKNCSTK